MNRIYRDGKTAEEVKEIYERKYEVDLSPANVKHVIRFLKKTSILKIISKSGSTKALDIGCGLGSWTEGLRLMGCKAQGIDLSENAIANAEKLYPLCSFVSGNALEMSNSTFDILFMRGASFYNQPLCEEGIPSENLVDVTERILELGNEKGLFILVCYTSRPRRPRLSPKGTSYYHTKDEFESFFSLFGKPEIYFIGSYLVCEVII